MEQDCLLAAALVSDKHEEKRMADDNTVSRSLHDLGLAAWFGGSLMGAIGVNGAAAQVEEPKQRLRVACAGWTAGEVPVEGGTDPSGDTPEDVAKAQQQLKFLQWGIRILTGAILVLNACLGEQQRPTQVSQGLFRRLLPGAKAA
jgi:hypothetical protein